MSALTRLAEKVEAGTASTMAFEDAGFDGWAELAYHGSLDAAMALHEAVLPEWYWSRASSGLFCVMRWDNGRIRASAGATADTPARAWLLAILRVLIERETP